MIPMPTQLSGAAFLASRAHALLADAPRCGKTGTAIMAADYVFARFILIVTTSSGRSVWERALKAWSTFGRNVQVVTPKTPLRPDTEVAIVSWGSVGDNSVRARLLMRHWDLIIVDEGHAARNFEAKRTQAVLGELIEDGTRLIQSTALVSKTDRVWELTGTPNPNSPFDSYARLRALAPERLAADPARGWPDVLRLSEFKKRYCKIKPKKIGNGAFQRWIDVIIGGRNEDELAARLEGYYLLRTQADVGIRPPVYETFPLILPKKVVDEAALSHQSKAILDAIEADDTKTLEMHLGPLMRQTGVLKAKAVVEAVKEEFDAGLDKIVLAFWHKDVGDVLEEGLAAAGVVRIDGSTTAANRLKAEVAFRGNANVMLAQIVAAGEAIDLSAASELLFVESSFQPAQMRQMSDRITNVSQTRLTRVRVASLANSIDDALQAALMRKWASIRRIMQ